MNDRERILSQSLKRVEIVAWSGTVDCLAHRLNMRQEDLIEALGRVQDLRNTPLKVAVSLARTAPVFAAARRVLTRPLEGEAASAVLSLGDIRW
jgi:hypothetical protein